MQPFGVSSRETCLWSSEIRLNGSFSNKILLIETKSKNNNQQQNNSWGKGSICTLNFPAPNRGLSSSDWRQLRGFVSRGWRNRCLHDWDGWGLTGSVGFEIKGLCWLLWGRLFRVVSTLFLKGHFNQYATVWIDSLHWFDRFQGIGRLYRYRLQKTFLIVERHVLVLTHLGFEDEILILRLRMDIQCHRIHLGCLPT